MTSLPWRSASQALARVPAGAHLVSLPHLAAPGTLLAALDDAVGDKGWTLSSGILLGDYPFLRAVETGRLAYRTWHVTAEVAGHVADGRVGFVPARASAVPRLLAQWGVDVALVRVSPPGPDGMCSFGAATGYARAAVDAARIVIAEIDPAVPRTCGDSLVAASTFDSLVESTSPIREYRTAPDSAASRLIAANVLSLVPREPVLQLGLGGIPESLARFLPDVDLGFVRVVGLVTDLTVDLFDKGVLHAADISAPAALSADIMGTSRVLEFAHDNPAIVMAPSGVAHDPCHLGRLDRLISVNTALEVDLAGNVNSEVLRGRQISGAGGGPDFVEAARRSAGGLTIIALPAASSDGTRSRVVERVEAVTVPGPMIDAVVTEYGIAHLAGRTTHERRDALIAVAHPDHRDALANGA